MIELVAARFAADVDRLNLELAALRDAQSQPPTNAPATD
jgi:hypothetical protein